MYKHAVKRYAGALVFMFTALAITAFVQAHGAPAKEPIWAYGFLTPPALGEKAPPPQNPPTHRLRPNEDPVE